MKIHLEYEVGIHERNNWYSENLQYRDPKLTFQQAVPADECMMTMDLIKVSRVGSDDPRTGKGETTKVYATDRLLEMCESIEGDPFKEVKPNLDAECIILTDRIDGHRKVVDYDNDKNITRCMKTFV